MPQHLWPKHVLPGDSLDPLIGTPRYPEAKDAFTINPAGPVPYSGYQAFGISIVALFPVLSLIACALRWYSSRLVKGLWLDDWLIFIATALGIPQAVFAIFFIRAGYWGIRNVDIPPHPENQGYFWSYLTRVFYAPILALVKISALLFLLRLGGSKKSVRVACKGLIIFSSTQLFAFFIGTIFTCQPVALIWDPRLEGHCINRGIFSVSLAVINIATDILTLLVPFVAFKDLKLSNRIRLALLSVFTLGVLVTVISVLRLYYVTLVWYVRHTNDNHYSLGYTTNTVEVNLAILTATIPALWPLARVWFPGMFESLGINQPYLYPDIEVGYVSSSRSSAGVLTTQSTADARVLRSKVLWSKRVRPPSYVRPLPGGGGDGGSGVDGVKPPDTRLEKEPGAPVERDDHPVEGTVDDEDVLDYHGILRRTETTLDHGNRGRLGEGAPTAQEPQPAWSEGSTSRCESKGSEGADEKPLRHHAH
ncbi:hypothetical protein VTK26DRAFT_3943 [Humicola hyalothermophila]